MNYRLKIVVFKLDHQIIDILHMVHNRSIQCVSYPNQEHCTYGCHLRDLLNQHEVFPH